MLRCPTQKFNRGVDKHSQNEKRLFMPALSVEVGQRCQKLEKPTIPLSLVSRFKC